MNRKHGVYGIPGIYFGDISIFPKVPQKLIFNPSSAYVTDYEAKEVIVNVDTDVSDWYLCQEVGNFYTIEMLNSTQFKITLTENAEQTFVPRIGIIGFYIGNNRYSYYQIKQKSKYYFRIDTPNPYNKDNYDEDIITTIDTNVTSWDAQVIKGNSFCNIIDKTTDTIAIHINENETKDYRVAIVRFSAFGEEALQFKIGQEMTQSEKDFKIYAAIDNQAQTKEYVIRQIHSTQWYAEVSPYSTRTPVLTASGNKLLINFTEFSGSGEAITIINVYPKIGDKPTELLFITIGDVPPTPGKTFNISPSRNFTAYSNVTTIPIVIVQQGYDGWTSRINSVTRGCSLTSAGGSNYNIFLGEYTLSSESVSTIEFLDSGGNIINGATITIVNLPGGGDKYFNILTQDLVINGDAQTVSFQIEQTGYDGWTFDVINNLRNYTNKFVNGNTANIVFDAYSGEQTTNTVIFKDSTGVELGRRTITTQPGAKSFKVIEGDQEINGSAQDIVFNVIQQGYDDNWTVEINSPKRTYGVPQQTNNLYKLPLNEYSGEDTTTILTFKSENTILATRTINTTNSKSFSVDKDEIVEISDNAQSVIYNVTQTGYDNQWDVIIESDRYATKQITGNVVTINFTQYDGASVYTTIRFVSGSVTLATRKIYTRATEKKFEVSPSSVSPISGAQQSITFTITQIKYDGWDASISSNLRSVTKSKQNNKLIVNFAEYYGEGTTTDVIFKDAYGVEITRISVITRDSEKEFDVTPKGPIEIDHYSKTLYFDISHKGYDNWKAVVSSDKRSCSGTKINDVQYKIDVGAYEEYGDNTVSYIKFYSVDNILLQEIEIDTKIKPKEFTALPEKFDPITGKQQDVSIAITQHGYDGWTVELESTRYCEKVVSGSNVTLKFSDYYGAQTDTIVSFKYGTQTLAQRIITTLERQKQFKVTPDKTVTPELLANGTNSYEFTITQDGYSQWYAEIDSSSTRKGTVTRNDNKLIVSLNDWTEQYTKGSTLINIYKESGATPIVEKLETSSADKDTVGISFSTLYADGYPYAIIESGKTIKEEVDIPLIISFFQDGSTLDIRPTFKIPANSSGVIKITNEDIHTRITENARDIWFRPNGSSEIQTTSQIIVVNEREGNYFAVVDNNIGTSIAWNRVGKDAGLEQTVYCHYVKADGTNISNKWYFTKIDGDNDLNGERIINTNKTCRWSDSRNLETTSRNASFRYSLENINRETSLTQSGQSITISMEFAPSISTVQKEGQSGSIAFTSNHLTDEDIKEMLSTGMLEIIDSNFIEIDINNYSYNIPENTNYSARTTDVILRMYFRSSHVGYKDMATVHCLQYGTPAPEEDTILIANDLSDYSSSFRVGLSNGPYVQPSEYVTVTKSSPQKLKYDSSKYVAIYLENGLTINGKLRDRDAGKDLTGSAKTYGQYSWVNYKMSDMLEWSTKTSGVLANIGLTNQ